MAIVLNMFEQLPLIGVFRTQVTFYALLNTGHILCLGVFLGAILPLDLGILRAPGFGWAATVAVPLRRMAVAAFLGAALIGLLLFSVRPTDYIGNGAFLAKVTAVALAGGNALLFARLSNGVVRCVQAALSLALWLFALLAGRFIGFL